MSELKWKKSPMCSVDYQEARFGRHILSITHKKGKYHLLQRVVGSMDKVTLPFDSEVDAKAYAQSFID